MQHDLALVAGRGTAVLEPLAGQEAGGVLEQVPSTHRTPALRRLLSSIGIPQLALASADAVALLVLAITATVVLEGPAVALTLALAPIGWVLLRAHGLYGE